MGALLLATILLGAGGFCIVIGAIIVVAAIGSGSNGDTSPAFGVLVGSAAMLIGAFLGAHRSFYFGADVASTDARPIRRIVQPEPLPARARGVR